MLSSPSGAGKSTIARKLLADEPELAMSVSATTRSMRPGEVDGKDYHFVDLEEFRRMVANDEFLEWAHVFNHRYGTPRAQVEVCAACHSRRSELTATPVPGQPRLDHYLPSLLRAGR